MYLIKRLRESQLVRLAPTLYDIASYSKYSRCTIEEIKDLDLAFVVYRGQEVVGFAGTTCYRGAWSLRLCAILPAHRGYGLQRLLIKARVDYLKANYPSINYINVWVGIKNVHSLRNVIKEGFCPEAEEYKVYHGIECMKLRKYFT